MTIFEKQKNKMTQLKCFYGFLVLVIAMPALSGESSQASNTSSTSKPVAASKKISSDVIKPYTAKLKGYIKGLPMNASGIRSLTKNSAGIWEMSFDASAGIFLKIKESSSFTLVSGLVRPEAYHYARSGVFGTQKEQKASFDWTKLRINWQKKDKSWDVKLQTGVLDNLSYQVKLRMDLASGKKELDYLIAEDDEVYLRSFTNEGEELLKTDIGKLNTVKVKVNRDNNRRETFIWFAKDWDYFFVKLLQIEGGSEYSIEIISADIDGRSIKGI